MKLTIGYWTKVDGKTSPYSQHIIEDIYGKNAKECMNQLAQRRQTHDCWKYSAIEIISVAD